MALQSVFLAAQRTAGVAESEQWQYNKLNEARVMLLCVLWINFKDMLKVIHLNYIK